MANITTLLTPSGPDTDSPDFQNNNITLTTSRSTSFNNTMSENYTTAESTVSSTVTVTRTAFPTTSNTSEVTSRKENGKYERFSSWIHLILIIWIPEAYATSLLYWSRILEINIRLIVFSSTIKNIKSRNALQHFDFFRDAQSTSWRFSF